MISIIIPTLNEEKYIVECISSIPHANEHQVIVVDGGSSDRTVELASSAGAITLSSTRPGRAIQMNTGASFASGDILLFLHADCQLPKNFSRDITLALQGTKAFAGAFQLRIDLPGAWVRCIEKGVLLRSKYMQRPYGDQAFFMTARNFNRVRMFDDVNFLEDLLMVCKIRKYGRIAITDSSVLTSGRRWQYLGVLKTTLMNQAILLGYLFGFPITKLQKFYRVAQKG